MLCEYFERNNVATFWSSPFKTVRLVNGGVWCRSRRATEINCVFSTSTFVCLDMCLNAMLCANASLAFNDLSLVSLGDSVVNRLIVWGCCAASSLALPHTISRRMVRVIATRVCEIYLCVRGFKRTHSLDNISTRVHCTKNWGVDWSDHIPMRLICGFVIINLMCAHLRIPFWFVFNFIWLNLIFGYCIHNSNINIQGEKLNKKYNKSAN